MRRHELRVRVQKALYNVKIWFVVRFYRRRLGKTPFLHRFFTTLAAFFSYRKVRIQKLSYFLPTLIAGLFITLLFLYTSHPVSSTIAPAVPELQQGVRVSFGDTELGWAPSKQSFFLLQEQMRPEDRWIFSEPVVRDRLQFEDAGARRPEKEEQDTLKNILSFTEDHSPGCGINLGPQTLIALSDIVSCKKVIDEILSCYTPEKSAEDETITDLHVWIEEKPEFIPDVFKKNDLLTVSEAVRYLKKGTLEEKTYTVVENDTIWSIAKKHGLSMDEIIRANPDIRPDYIYPNDKLSLIVPKPFLTVRTEYTHEFTRRIQYRTIVKTDPALYRTEAITERGGQFGKERVTVKINMTNGLLTSRETIENEILSSPVTAIVRIGTARTPEDVLVASAILPRGIGVITSHFGPRWGRFHYGIDVSSPLGTPVHAYKSGTVVFTGYDPILGNLVTISHGNDLVTRYGHGKTILVTAGQTVSAGDVIALSGNSGYSTGPHVHFEIRRKGVAMDPLQYLKNIAAEESRPVTPTPSSEVPGFFTENGPRGINPSSGGQ